jgi:hypothetical protein
MISLSRRILGLSALLIVGCGRADETTHASQTSTDTTTFSPSLTPLLNNQGTVAIVPPIRLDLGQSSRVDRPAARGIVPDQRVSRSSILGHLSVLRSGRRGETHTRRAAFAMPDNVVLNRQRNRQQKCRSPHSQYVSSRLRGRFSNRLKEPSWWPISPVTAATRDRGLARGDGQDCLCSPEAVVRASGFDPLSSQTELSQDQGMAGFFHRQRTGTRHYRAKCRGLVERAGKACRDRTRPGNGVSFRTAEIARTT